MSSLPLFHNRYQCTGLAKGECVLLHGWGMHSLVWDDVVPALLERFHVTVIDLPGMGQSPMPTGDYTLDYLVDHVLSAAPTEKALWIGWSLGGMVATHIAALHPERVGALCTVASNVCFTQKPGWPNAMDPAVFQRFQTLYEEDAEGTQIRFLALNCKGSDSMRDDVRRMKDMLYHCGLPARKALREGLVILDNTDLRPLLPHMRAPWLAVFGEHDALVPAAAAADLEAACHSAGVNLHLAMIAGTAHVPFLSAPDTFMRAINDFLLTLEQGT